MKIQKKIIISHLFDSDQRLLTYLFEEPLSLNLRTHPNLIKAEVWELTSEQQTLVLSALDIWNGSGNVFLSDLLNNLETRNLYRLILALKDCHDLKTKCEQFNPNKRSQNYE